MLRALIITGDRDVKRSDYTCVFKPESELFAKTYGFDRVNFVRIDVSKSMPKRRQQLFDELAKLEEIRFTDIAVFMHGWQNGIQCGLRLEDVNPFISKLAWHDLVDGGDDSDSPIHVCLYCCLTGDVPGSPASAQRKEGPGGDGGFADRVRDEFCKAGKPWVKVYAHTTAGHATRNPFVRIFEGKGSPVGAVDGDWLIRPPKKGRASPLWKPWVGALMGKPPFDKGLVPMPLYFQDTAGMVRKTARSNFRFLAPFMTIEELHFALVGAI